MRRRRVSDGMGTNKCRHQPACGSSERQLLASPPTGEGTPDDKFFGNFPYPYMNGLLHLGHAFSVSKVRIGSPVRAHGSAWARRSRAVNKLFPFKMGSKLMMGPAGHDGVTTSGV